MTIAVVGAVGTALALLFARLLFDKPVLLIYLQIIYCSVVFFMISEMRIPNAAKYLTDLITILLLLRMISQRENIRRLNVNLRAPLLAVGLFVLACVMSAIVNAAYSGVSVVYFLWGVRGYFRHYVFFAACIVFLSIKDAENILRYLTAILPINALLCSYQKFIQGYGADMVGGIFGTRRGCDGLTNLYLLIVMTTLVVWYAVGKIQLAYPVLGAAVVLYIAALAELKVMFFEVAVILAVAIIARPGKRTLALALVGVAMIAAAIKLLLLLYPGWEGFFTTNAIREYTIERGYGGENAVNRLTAGGYMLKNILEGIPQKLFGIGLGNADGFLDYLSPFKQQYEYLRYYWFLYAFILTEVGIAGLFAYLSFFVANAVNAVRIFFRANKGTRYLCMVTALMCMLAFLLLLYNMSMRAEGGYLIYFITAIPYILQKADAPEPVNARINGVPVKT